MYVNRILKSAIALTGAAVILTACAGGTDSAVGPNTKFSKGGVSFAPTVPDIEVGSSLVEEKFIVCKEIVGGEVTTASFTAEITSFDARYDNETIEFDLTDGQCADFGFFGGEGINVTVTEDAIADYTTTWTRENFFAPGGSSGVSSENAGLAATDSAYGDRPNADGGVVARGTRIVFTNTYTPRQTGEGCTPGYWRQEHHFGNWTAPYDPTDGFNATFGIGTDWFPDNYTLLQGVWANGGGKNALARHAVAALLNAASGGVDYDYTVDEVIAMVQAAYADGSLIESTKNDLAAKNELGCGLARAEVDSNN